MAAPARPYWTGYLKLSLVTIAVRLYTASSERERVRFHQIHEPSGERVRQQLVVPGIGPVERDDIVKGFEYEKGHYVTVDPEDLKRLRLETTDTIDIVEFVEAVDPIYFDAPYYLVPDGAVAEQGYRVIREALSERGTIAVGQLAINGRAPCRRPGGSRAGGTAAGVARAQSRHTERPAQPPAASRRRPRQGAVQRTGSRRSRRSPEAPPQGLLIPDREIPPASPLLL